MRERSVYHYLPLETRTKLIAIPADFSNESLGMDRKVYDEIASEITGLIHCAWPVNFNLALASFEADCIAGAHNLIALCLKAQRPEPATFNFCSSVSAVAATKGGFVTEALPESLECAQDMGYAQYKLVAEHICVDAAKSYGIKSRVLRVGQVVADTVHGIWNSTEAIPLMMQAGVTTGAIPRLDENPLWLPVDVVASVISDISLSDAGPGIMNVVNSKFFHWTRDLLPALHRAGMQFSEPNQREWVVFLRKSNPDPVANPPIKLVEFFASKCDNDLPRTGLHTTPRSHASSRRPWPRHRCSIRTLWTTLSGNSKLLLGTLLLLLRPPAKEVSSSSQVPVEQASPQLPRLYRKNMPSPRLKATACIRKLPLRKCPLARRYRMKIDGYGLKPSRLQR
jgi:nucleoside-diphosphate-sugar epimerase